MKRGLPRALMTDNGAAMLAEETRQGLQRLAYQHQTTLPYSPYQNGKQEAFWGHCWKAACWNFCAGSKNLKLSFVNQAAQAWVEQDYQRRVHREIKTTPLQRMLNGPDVARPGTRQQTFCAWHLHAASSRTPRRSDATVALTVCATNCPFALLTCRSVFLRHAGWDKSQMTLVDAEYRCSPGAPAATR